MLKEMWNSSAMRAIWCAFLARGLNLSTMFKIKHVRNQLITVPAVHQNAFDFYEISPF